ncbi:MAG: ATP-binding cassette domain-containing protein [Phycisphaerales bacterium]|nr:ATP-binding cassette domain-containing protein [Phycisphaerales bacterium]
MPAATTANSASEGLATQIALSDESVPALCLPGSSAPLLRVDGLHAHFPMKSGFLQRTTGWVRAVDGVTLELARGETLGLVGESGCGKTTIGRAILRLLPATSGRVVFDGQDVLAARAGALKQLRRRMQIVFQDPAGSLNPRMRILSIIGEPLRVHGLVASADELRARVESLLVRCGMPRTAADRYPHEFSGGQRQRICIARALALDPHFIVCDEPTSALDVSIQAQILNLLKDLQRDLGLSLLFISHNMAVIQHMCDRIAVMHKGKIVETGPKRAIIDAPRHEYTRALLRAVPIARPPAARGVDSAR